MSKRANNTDAINSSKINALRVTANRHIVSRLFLSSKETLEKRGIIESIFRVLSGLPSENKRDKYVSSQVTKDSLCRVLKPADYNSARIEAFSSDIKKIKAHPGLAETGLMIRENMKLNLRLIYGVPADMSTKEIENKLLAQNLSDVATNDVKVVYIFTPKQDRRITSSIVEVTPAVRRTLLECGWIYLHYSACSFAGHVRIVQCYRCLSFGYIAKDCKDKASCGHCAGVHEMKNRKNRDQPIKCLNCERHHVSHGDLVHYGCCKMFDTG
ncbi:hypothetical protein ACFW04_011482 [Cataglyphis niger]